MKKIVRKMIVGITICVMTISNVNLYADALDNTLNMENTVNNHLLTNIKYSLSDKTRRPLKSDLDKMDIPQDLAEEVEIDIDDIKGIDDVDSLDLNSFTTVEKNKTKTLYVFDAPIKYYDKKANEVKFIDNSLKKSSKKYDRDKTYGYENTANNVKVYVPKKSNENILVENADKMSLKFSPVGSGNTDVSLGKFDFLGNIEEGAEFKDAFGEGYDLQYIPQNTGIKENIIIQKNRKKYTFEFIIETEGMKPSEKKGKTIDFIKNDNNDVVFTLGELFIKDSYVGGNNRADHISFNNYYEIEEISKGKYRLTYILDKNFLEKKSTKYPVLVDPSISPISSINDAPVYSSKKTSNFASNPWIELGDVGGSYGTGYGFFQTKAMKKYTYINPKKITSASLRVYEGSGTTYKSTIKAYDTDDTWSSTSITWKNKPGKDGGALDSKSISSSGFYEFKITSLVKSWLEDVLGEGGYEATYGVMLVPSTSSQKRKDFCSANYGTASKRPTIKISYEEDTSINNETYFIKNEKSGLYLDANTSNDNVIQYNINNNDNQQWKVVKKTNGYYTISNCNYGSSGYLDVDDETNCNADIWDGGSDDWIKYKIVKNNDGTGTYRIMSKYLDDLKALYTVGGSVSAGANVKFATYSGDDKSKWKFIKVPDTYRKSDMSVSEIIAPKNSTVIASNRYYAKISNRYIRVGATTTRFEFLDSSDKVVGTVNVNTPALQSNATTKVFADWKPSKEGNYKVRVTANASNNVAENYKGNNIATKAVVAIYGYRVTVNNYYDLAFECRYGANVNSRIQILNHQVSDVFKQVFGLVVTNTAPQKIISLADNCKLKRGLAINSSTINLKCPGGDGHSPSCTDNLEIYRDFIARYPGNNITDSVLWTGNKLYDANGKESNRSFKWYNNGIFLQELYDTSAYFSTMPACLVHEMSHTFGAPDHYHEIREDGSCTGGSLCKVCNPSSNRSTSCIMCDGWQDVVGKEDKSVIFCQGCYNDILNHLKSHH